jgi:hypothetical protein
VSNYNDNPLIVEDEHTTTLCNVQQAVMLIQHAMTVDNAEDVVFDYDLRSALWTNLRAMQKALGYVMEEMDGKQLKAVD